MNMVIDVFSRLVEQIGANEPMGRTCAQYRACPMRSGYGTILGPVHHGSSLSSATRVVTMVAMDNTGHSKRNPEIVYDVVLFYTTFNILLHWIGRKKYRKYAIDDKNAQLLM